MTKTPFSRAAFEDDPRSAGRKKCFFVLGAVCDVQCLRYLFESLEREDGAALDAKTDSAVSLAEEDAESLQPPVLPWSVHVQFVEVYNEKVYDLLGVAQGQQFASIEKTQGGYRENALTKQQIHQTNAPFSLTPATASLPPALTVRLHKSGRAAQVVGAERLQVRNAEEALSALRKGLKARRTAETKMNASSSRSHALFSVFLSRVSPSRRALTRGSLHLVDLAGSERQRDTEGSGER